MGGGLWLGVNVKGLVENLVHYLPRRVRGCDSTKLFHLQDKFKKIVNNFDGKAWENDLWNLLELMDAEYAVGATLTNDGGK